MAFYAVVHFNYQELSIALKEIYRVTKSGGLFLFSFHQGNENTYLTDFLGQPVEVTFHFFETPKVVDLVKRAGWITQDVITRYPYEGKEYPSYRSYILCKKER